MPKKKNGKLAVILSAAAAVAVITAGALFLPQLLNNAPVPVEASAPSVSEQSTASTSASTTVSEAAEPEIELLPRELAESSVISSVVADKTNGDVVATDTSFTITAVEDFSEDELKNRMQIEPQLPYTLKKTDTFTYSVKLSSALDKGSMVKLSFINDDGAPKSWAFQTEDIFRILSVLPADGGKDVPVNTGVEMKFSFAADKDKAADFFEISPSAEGRFEFYRTTLVFVPTEKLAENTVYTVNVKAGLPSLDGPVLSEGKTFSFKTAKADKQEYCYTSNSISETFLPDDPKVIELYHSENYLDKDFNIKLYRYNGADAYYEAISDSVTNAENELNNYEYYYARPYNSWVDDYIFPVDGLDMVYESTEKVLHSTTENRFNPSFLMLPDDLAEGWYIADVTDAANSVRIQKLIQVSTVSVYSAVLAEQAAFFVNDTVTGKAINGAAIELSLNGKTFTSTTDANGNALLDFTAGENYGVIKITHNGKTFIDRLNCSCYQTTSPDANYYMYIYTDREIYLTSDTVKIWGMIKPRTKDSPAIPNDLYVRLGDSETFGEKAEIKLFADGTFTSEISYKNYSEQWYMYVSLMSGDEEYCYKCITVRDYEKPIYVLDTNAPETVWMPHINSFTASITASYYDGSAAPGLMFTAGDDKGTDFNLVTDKNGYAEITAKAADRDTWEPCHEYVDFSQDGIEDNYQRKAVTYYAYHRDTMLETEFDGDTNTLHLSTHKINQVEPTANYDEYWDYTYYDFDYDAMRGAGTNTTVTGTVTRYWSTKEETGTYYDFIRKKTYTTYCYERHEEVIGTFTTSTVNGVGAFENLPLNYPDSYYSIDMTYVDSLGQSVNQSTSLYDYSKYYYYNWYITGKRYYELTADDYTFTEGQTINFTLSDDNKVDEKPTGRIFYAAYQRGFISLNNSSAPTFSHVMTADYIPNIKICAAYFDGKHVYPISCYQDLQFDPTERELSLDIAADKEVYGPSDTANVTVTALDMNGNPAVNAAVSISVVDEAAFAIMNQNANPLDSVFEMVYYPSARIYYSYIQHTLDGEPMGERGGGEGENDGVRRDFKDTAAFLTDTTDASGKVTFTFKLPDNLTSWRATVQAVGNAMNGRLCVGAKKENPIVSLPMYLIPITLDEYVEGDDIAVSATLVGASDINTQITARLTGENVDETKTAGSKETMNFGKMPVGEYKVLFTVSDGVNADAIELPLKVVDTRLELPAVRTFTLKEESIEINPISWPVTLVFRDTEYDFYSNLLNRLSVSYGDNLDCRIAQAYADTENGRLTQEEFISEFAGITSDGIANLLSYSEDDYELTALICTAVPEIVDKEKVITAFYEKLDNKNTYSSDVACCYMGLAALNEPVMNEVVRLLDDPAGFTYDDRLMLCAALALLGNDADAEKYYTEMTENIKIYCYGEDNPVAHVSENENDNVNSIQGSTRLAIIIASALNLSEEEGMARYLYGSYYTSYVERRDYSLVLEQVKFMRTYVFKPVPDSIVNIL